MNAKDTLKAIDIKTKEISGLKRKYRKLEAELEEISEDDNAWRIIHTAYDYQLGSLNEDILDAEAELYELKDHLIRPEKTLSNFV